MLRKCGGGTLQDADAVSQYSTKLHKRLFPPMFQTTETIKSFVSHGENLTDTLHSIHPTSTFNGKGTVFAFLRTFSDRCLVLGSRGAIDMTTTRF